MTLKNNITFSIIIPAYKRLYLQECIKSVLTQTYENFEVIIVNDASPEDLYSVVCEFNDPHIRYYLNPKNCGAINVVDNWNIGLVHATCDYVICMGDDDKLLPNCLEEYVRLIEKYPGVGLLHAWTEIINEHSESVELTAHRCEFESVYSLMWHRWNCYALQFIGDFCFRLEWLRSKGGFYKLPLAWGSDNISALIGASENGIANTQVVTFQYRRNSQSISSTGNVEMKIKALLIEMDWCRQFLTMVPTDVYDKMFRQMLLKQLPIMLNKNKGWTIGCDLRQHSIFRILHWWRLRKKYGLTGKVLFYALIQAMK